MGLRCRTLAEERRRGQEALLEEVGVGTPEAGKEGGPAAHGRTVTREGKKEKNRIKKRNVEFYIGRWDGIRSLVG